MTNPNGRFGIHGGQYIPETLMNAVIELEQAYNHYKNDPQFCAELTERSGMSAVPQLSVHRAGCALPFTGGKARNAAGMSASDGTHGRGRNHGGTAQGIPHFRGTVSSGIHHDPGRENHAEQFYKILNKRSHSK